MCIGVCLIVHICTTSIQGSTEVRKISQEHTESCKHLGGYWEQNLCPLQKHPVLSIAESLLQPVIIFIWLKIYSITLMLVYISDFLMS